jgi:small subunit ribosomal protein S15
MALTQEKKKKIITDYKRSKQDTGSPEVQVAMLTTQINELEAHFRGNPKDHHSRRGLITKVGLRKRLLAYLRSESPERYQELINRLNLRK